jgi:hypothetical protein
MDWEPIGTGRPPPLGTYTIAFDSRPVSVCQSIAATRSGIPAALPDIFPGCRVVRWQPVQKALSGKVKEAAEFLIDWFKKNPEGLLSFNSRVKRSGWIPRTSERTFAVIQDSRKRPRTTTSQKPRSLATAGVAS